MNPFRKSRVVVVSVRAGAAPVPRGYTLVMVDRTHPVLGNEHRIASGPMSFLEREEAIRRYREDFADDEAVRGPKTRAVEELARRVESGEKLALGCWCKPLSCHADVIKNKIDAILSKENG